MICYDSHWNLNKRPQESCNCLCYGPLVHVYSNLVKEAVQWLWSKQMIQAKKKYYFFNLINWYYNLIYFNRHSKWSILTKSMRLHLIVYPIDVLRYYCKVTFMSRPTDKDTGFFWTRLHMTCSSIDYVLLTNFREKRPPWVSLGNVVLWVIYYSKKEITYYTDSIVNFIMKNL